MPVYVFTCRLICCLKCLMNVVGPKHSNIINKSTLIAAATTASTLFSILAAVIRSDSATRASVRLATVQSGLLYFFQLIPQVLDGVKVKFFHSSKLGKKHFW